ncbi:regulatory protein RecX [Gordonia sp. (in: high G+C Gram-positive bacteria)]|uniref:regulatory protein RecX n=1 Tax=Gordonia sp. (in: high G+C Gram-positive bacteria) TaxID=84139 RepID=UPI003529151E
MSDDKPGPSAWDAALRLLGVRARSRAEIAERLARRGFDQPTIDDVLARLEESGLIDDDEFAREWAGSRSRYSGRGRLALRRELRTKGVAAHTIEAALAEIEPDDERAQAAELAAKKLASWSLDLTDPGDRAKAYRRLAGVLGRRGFPPDVISSVVADTLRSGGPGGSDARPSPRR